MTTPGAVAGPRRNPRVVAAVLAAVAAVALLLCAGLVPVLLGVGQDEEEGSVLACGAPPPIGGIAGVSARQAAHAWTIVTVGRQLRVPPRGWVVALATALQESGLKNYANDNPRYPILVGQSLELPHEAVGRDHDSVGLFQQRVSPPAGEGSWGTAAELMTPATSATRFYAALLRVPGWQAMRVTDAAQAVQHSAIPGAYQKWEPLATALAARIVAAGGGVAAVASPAARPTGSPAPTGSSVPTGSPAPTGSSGAGVPTGPASAAGAAAQQVGVLGCVPAGRIGPAGWTAPVTAAVGSRFRTSDRPGHDGVDLIAVRGSLIRAASGGIVSTVVCNASSGSCDVDGSPSTRGCGWYVEVQHGGGIMTRYCHMVQRPAVVVGQRVGAGQPLGLVGSSGNSSGPHLHFEVHVQGEAVDPVAFMLGRGVPLGRPV